MVGRRELPSLRALAAFEAAGRQRSFSGAARELGMSQSAVSQQVAWLEAELGRPLFDRGHRGVTPNADGLALLRAATSGFDAIEAASRAVRCRPSVTVLQVATDFGFAAWWLMPRLSVLQGRLPDVEIRLLTSQHEAGLHPQTDVSVVFGRGPWPGCAVQRLTRERVMPVCSPQFLTRLGAAPEPGLLGQSRLLHLAAPAPGRWLSWQDWFAHHGIQRDARRDDLTFDSYQLVLQAALQGQGAALGWEPLINGLIKDRSLVVMAAGAVESDRGYHLVVPQKQAAHPAVMQFCDWLVEECEGLP